MNIVIRKAKIEDYSVLIELFDEIYAIHSENLSDLFENLIPIQD